MPRVLESFARLRSRADLVLIEGAGSAAEVNLRAGDIANMGFARAVDAPVVLVGDIDRGGVIAQLVGCQAVIEPSDAALIKGFIVNKFRGDPSLFEDGMAFVARRTGWRALGLLPFFEGAARLPAEDAFGLRGQSASGQGGVKIAVPLLPNIANFDDLDPLKAEPGVSVIFIPPGAPLPGDARLVILPGRRRPSPTLWPFAPRAGISTSPPICVGAGVCWAYAEAIKCWDEASPTPPASKVRRARWRGWDCSMSRQCSGREKS